MAARSIATGLPRAPLVDASTAPDAAMAPMISRLFFSMGVLPNSCIQALPNKPCLPNLACEASLIDRTLRVHQQRHDIHDLLDRQNLVGAEPRHVGARQRRV